MITLKKTHAKIISVLIALVFVGSVVALALSQTNNMPMASAAPASNVGVVDYQQFGSLKIITDAQEQFQKETQQAQADFEQKAAGMNDQEKQEYYQQTMQRLQRRNMELMEPINKQIEDAVKKIADTQGLTVVLHKDTVIYGGKDITQDVIKELSK